MEIINNQTAIFEGDILTYPKKNKKTITIDTDLSHNQLISVVDEKLTPFDIKQITHQLKQLDKKDKMRERLHNKLINKKN